MKLDKRSFRANIYAGFEAMSGFAEDAFIGHKVKIGTKAVIAVTDRDPRCKMITLDPDTSEARPEVLRRVAQAHDGKAGLYGVVLIEGTSDREMTSYCWTGTLRSIPDKEHCFG
jgi:uncharacterized protein YcbX